MSHIFSNCSRHAGSVCKTSLSVVELIARYKAVSSSKSLTLDLTSFLSFVWGLGPFSISHSSFLSPYLWQES